MQIERSRHLQAKSYERTDRRTGYANGYKAKTVKSRLGTLDLSVPQVRDSSFYFRSLEKGLRSERALKLAVDERYVQGAAICKVKAITEQLCGFEVSSMDVSRASYSHILCSEAGSVLLLSSNKTGGHYPCQQTTTYFNYHQ